MNKVGCAIAVAFAMICTGCVPEEQSKTSVPDRVKRLIETHPQLSLTSVQLTPDGNNGYFGSALNKSGVAWNVTVTPVPKKEHVFKVHLTNGKFEKWCNIVAR